MHVQHVAAAALLVLFGPIVAAACVAPVDSIPGESAGGANTTPAPPESVGEVEQAFAVCECSTQSDWCPWTVGGKCVAGFNSCTKTPLAGCGTGGFYACTGWCVRP